jgi:hypothetical protein
MDCNEEVEGLVDSGDAAHAERTAPATTAQEKSHFVFIISASHPRATKARRWS